MAKRLNYASLYTLRPDGRYQGYYRDGNGKRHVVCDKDPENLYNKIQEKLQPKEKPPLLFRDIAKLWQDEAWENIAEGTKASYAAHFNRAVDRFGDVPAAEISAYDINTHLLELKARGFSASTINSQRVVYRNIFQRAIIDREYGTIVRINPATDVKLPTGLPKPKKREAPEDDIVQKIQDNCTTAYFGDFAMFLMATGMRRGEALAIRWADIDFDTGFISVRYSVSLRGIRGVISGTKTENGIRQVPILDPLLKVLQRPDDAKDTDFVFHGEDPSLPMPHSAYIRKWNHYCREMGFVIDTPEERISAQGKKYTAHNYKNTLTAHYLRHGYATMLYESGVVDEKEGAKLMGHADEEMLRKVYAHLRAKKEASASERLKKVTKNGLSGFDCAVDCKDEKNSCK